jgi:hypothetical protein
MPMRLPADSTREAYDSHYTRRRGLTQLAESVFVSSPGKMITSQRPPLKFQKRLALR